MKIEVGKTYDVSAMWKKSTFEIEQYKNEETDQMLNTEVMWRSGSFRVTIKNEEEASMLQSSIGDDGDIWDYEDYEEIELLETWDGCSEDFVFYGPNWTDEDKEELEDSYLNQDDDEWFSMYEFLENRGYAALDCNWQIHNGTIVEESEHEVGAVADV